jgi:hypothetical protein
MASQLKKRVIALAERRLPMTTTTNHLSSIATRERKSRVRDYLFAALIILAGGIAVSSVKTAAHAAATATQPATGQTRVITG